MVAICLRDRSVYIPSMNMSMQCAQCIAERLLLTINQWDSIYINSISCQRSAFRILLNAICANHAHLKSFAIHSVHFGSDHGKYCISNLFSIVRNLQCLNLSNISIDRASAMHIIDSIHDNQYLLHSLQILNLSGNPSIGETIECVKKIAAIMIRAKNLSELYLKSCSISSDGFGYMERQIVSLGNDGMESLETLDLSDGIQRLSANGVLNMMVIIKSCPNLRCLHLMHRKFDMNDSMCYSVLWNGLCEIHSLNELNLSCISSKTLQKLSFAALQSAESMLKISKLIIRYIVKQNDESDMNKMYHSLDHLLTFCPNLTWIDFGGNGIKDKHLKIISKTLSYKLPLLRTLLLANNELSANKGCKILIKIVNGSKECSKIDSDQKVEAIMCSNENLSKDIASVILNYTNGFQDYDIGINEILLYRNQISDVQHRNIEKLASLLRRPLQF